MTRVAELKNGDIIEFGYIGASNKAIVKKVYGEHAHDRTVWYADIEKRNGKIITIDDSWKFKKVSKQNQTKLTELSNNETIPTHYKGTKGVDVIEFIQQQLTEEQFEGFMLGNIIKYATRYGRKGDKVDDLKKIGVYQNRMLRSLTSKRGSK
ncbi:DUF3310 domain-containing protein [Staphylococcus haemolyticus]|uniref:DUF3310 domain-containing protein n=1 Tax=Staphylococcus haemolyticus TaxID=1283 RepID=UPI00051CD803|nr:DUF3310 domain-containing protein [Staphylococcus haemolyticus]KGJ25364.1 hypothetical protein ES24_09785 [Staphylococcus haemolyticus]KGJ29250.1 hypothetical protein ES23_05720 [Staphylococcus haemolyticus]MCH4326204.1 DUF3310 domain-containing protein [Staphylococcus haemolyticus]MCH4414271.1 DUF3310 domain-containing protein [Staphylococcus haemolyticus]MCH4419080.1 DUF3310 domain-containing protein [Staphylococcus haemolyticus]